MRIITNPGLNVSPLEVERYRVTMMPQRIMVDGEEHDTRTAISFFAIDTWMKEAKQTPYIVGTTAAEFLDVFRRTVDADPDILVITASRKLIGTYQAAVSAARTLSATAAAAKARVEVVDCANVDVSGALAVTYAGEAQRAGLPFERILQGTQAFAAASAGVAVPAILDYLVKGGRATFVRALVANALGLSPVIVFEKGEMRAEGQTKRANMIAAIVDQAVKMVGRRTPVWAGVLHGGSEAEAHRLVRAIKTELDVQRVIVRPMCATTYLNIGPQSLALYYTRVDALPWLPPRAES